MNSVEKLHDGIGQAIDQILINLIEQIFREGYDDHGSDVVQKLRDPIESDTLIFFDDLMFII